MNAINIVHDVVRVDPVEGSGTTSIPCNIHGVLSGRAVIVHFKFIEMRMSIKLSADNIVESIDDATIFTRPEAEATATASWNVSENVNSFVCSFSSEKRVVEPLHGRCNLISAVHHPPVVDVTIIVVQCNQTESWTHQEGVVAALPDCVDGVTRNPSVALPNACYQEIPKFITKSFSQISRLYQNSRTTTEQITTAWSLLRVQT